MLAAGGVAVTAGGAIGALPEKYVVKRLSQQRFFAIDRGQETAAVILAHE
jgi:hypothetical protein